MGLTTYTQEIEEGDVEKLRELLKRGGFEMLEKPYAYYGARKGKLNVTVYEKGPKVLIQGKDTEEFVKFILEPEILGEARLGYEEVHNPEMFQPHFGIDESGKGDYFGPLVIAGVYTELESTRALMEAGVMDWPGCDLAQEADLAAEVVVEVSQTPIVTVVHPVIKIG